MVVVGFGLSGSGCGNKVFLFFFFSGCLGILGLSQRCDHWMAHGGGVGALNPKP